LELPRDCAEGRHVYWVYGIVIKPEFPLSRDQLMPWLKARGVDTRAFFHPMNLQPCLQTIEGFQSRPCPVAERIGASGLYLPSGPTLQEAQVEQVCERLKEAARS
jgi:perosamine synthetase